MSLNVRIALAALCAALVGCSGPQSNPEVAAAKAVSLEALLGRSGGAPATGNVKFSDSGDGMTVSIFINNLTPGVYRMALHATGNCSSFNFFSAGPAWAPPGVTKPAAELMPIFNTNGDGDKLLTFHVSGVRTTGENSVLNRSVVIHQGTMVSDAQPDVPNNRVLCGVIGPATSFLN